MKYVRLFESFKDDRTLYVFDLDDTLVKNPSFSDIINRSINENFDPKNFFKSSIKKIGVRKNQIKFQDGRLYVDDIDKSIVIDNNWIRKGNRIYLIQPDEFEISELNLPIGLTKLIDKYNESKNKCIITARPEVVKEQLTKRINKLGIDTPNFGIHLFPRVKRYAVGKWKGEKIVEIVNKYGFKKIVYYDDNRNYIKSASEVIRKKLPNVELVTIKYQD